MLCHIEVQESLSRDKALAERLIPFLNSAFNIESEQLESEPSLAINNEMSWFPGVTKLNYKVSLMIQAWLGIGGTHHAI